MPAWLTDVIEFAVGVVCLVAGIASWKRRGLAFRLTGGVLVLAGVVALVHSALSATS